MSLLFFISHFHKAWYKNCWNTYMPYMCRKWCKIIDFKVRYIFDLWPPDIHIFDTDVIINQYYSLR